MKQKTLPQNPITKSDLLEALQLFSDKGNKRFEEMQQASDRKFEEFRQEIRKELAAIEIRMDVKLEKIELRIDDRARIYNSQLLTKFDQWAHDVKTAQTERVITADQLSKLHNEIDTLEKRVTKLENN